MIVYRQLISLSRVTVVLNKTKSAILTEKLRQINCDVAGQRFEQLCESDASFAHEMAGNMLFIPWGR